MSRSLARFAGLAVLAAALLLTACPPSQGTGDGGIDSGSTLVPCPDRPGDVPRAPSAQLPCELLPPGSGH